MTKPSTSIPSSEAPLGAHSSTGTVGRISTAPALLRKECAVCGAIYPTHFVVCPTDATRLREVSQHEADPLIGQVINETYEVMRVIGEGGMGRVYEARHTRLFSKRFAVKVLYSDLTRQAEVVQRFLREAEATSALDHPNIVGMLDVNQLPDGRPYIIAELLEGHQLGDYFEQRGKLPVSEAVAICRPVCHALARAHEKGIVHRDIKPENLFLVGEGAQRTVKVLDFGISSVGAAGASLTKTGMVMGTPAYMPPEQARGARVDHRADIYSVGAILYEALTGNPPFKGTDPVSTLGAVLTQMPVPARSFAPDVPPELELVLQKAMAKSPDHRYDSMHEFAAALAEFDRSDVSRSQQLQSIPPPRPSEVQSFPPGLRGQLLRAYTANRPAEHARKRLWGLSLTTASFLLAGLFALCVAVLRATHGEVALTLKERLIWLSGSLGVVGVAGFAWAVAVFWEVWPRTSRVVEVVARMQRVLAATFGTYALGTSLVRLIGALRATAESATWPGWDLIVFPIALLVGGVVAWLEISSRKLD